MGKSQPSWAAWIEIANLTLKCLISAASQPTRAAWIEMLSEIGFNIKPWSQPTRAAWIEILLRLKPCSLRLLSQPTRAAWIEMQNSCLIIKSQMPSQPSWAV